MLIWTLAILLFLVVGALGYLQGALRLVVSLVGLVVGLLLAFPLAPLLQKLVPLVGIKHPMWSIIWPPIWAFLLIFLVFIGVAFFVQRKVNLYFKYRADDFTRIRWERLNKALGICVGVMMGGVWLLVIGIVVHIAGYFAVQVVNEETSSLTFRYLSRAKHDLRTSGLEKCVASFDRMPANYYQICDILGLIYNNPILLSRLSHYPPFLSLGQKQEFQDIATDAEFNNLLQTKGDIAQILNHPKVQAVIYNSEILQELLQQDLKDFRNYLETGKSPKFDEEKILGRWTWDSYSTLVQERKKRPNLTAPEMMRLKKTMTEVLKSVSFMATTDNKATRKVEASEQLKQTAQAEAAAANAQSPDPTSRMSPELARRYNLGPSGSRRPQPPAAPQQRPAVGGIAATTEIVQPLFSAQGTWQRDGDKYQLKFQDEKGRAETVQATADDEKLVINGPVFSWVFNRVDY